MAYHVYTTDCIILSYKSLREADRIYTILTQDLGVVRATAISVRKEESKQRAALEPYSVSSISFVKGREFWRIKSASIKYNLRNILEKSLFLSFVRGFSLLEKLVAGEGGHPRLLQEIGEVIEQSRQTEAKSEHVEILLVGKILFELGYLSLENVPSLRMIQSNKKSIIKAINEGIRASHLI